MQLSRMTSQLVVMHAGESLSAKSKDTPYSIELPSVPDKAHIMQWLRQTPDAVKLEPEASLEMVSVQAPRADGQRSAAASPAGQLHFTAIPYAA